MSMNYVIDLIFRWDLFSDKHLDFYEQYQINIVDYMAPLTQKELQRLQDIDTLYDTLQDKYINTRALVNKYIEPHRSKMLMRIIDAERNMEQIYREILEDIIEIDFNRLELVAFGDDFEDEETDYAD